LLTRVPLPEIYNNLGVVEARRGQRAAAVENFMKAVNADPNDADYRFNLAVALLRNGDSAGASRQLKEELQRHPADGEAKTLQDTITRNGPAPAATNSLFPANPPRLPLERMKRNYDEASYRQLELQIRNFNQSRQTGAK
jgi:tetratricopeptide (TPR) repeat protein